MSDISISFPKIGNAGGATKAAPPVPAPCSDLCRESVVGKKGDKSIPFVVVSEQTPASLLEEAKKIAEEAKRLVASVDEMFDSADESLQKANEALDDANTVYEKTEESLSDVSKSLKTVNAKADELAETASKDHTTYVSDHLTATSDHANATSDHSTFAANEAKREQEYTSNINTFKNTIEKVYKLDEYISDMKQINESWNQESSKLSQTNAIVQNALRNGLGTSEYSIVFMEESAIDSLTSSGMTSGVLYMGMESLGTSSLEFTAGAAVFSDVEFEDGLAMVNGIAFNNGYAII